VNAFGSLKFTDDYIGITQTTNLSGQTGIIRLIGSVSESHSGLNIGEEYFIDGNTGLLTNTATNYTAGRAIS
jgi:hypothetical protein